MLVQALTGFGLIDEYHLLVYPVVLGSGKRLLVQVPTTKLALVEAKSFGSGVVGLTYRLAAER